VYNRRIIFNKDYFGAIIAYLCLYIYLCNLCVFALFSAFI